jgi:hypothetical protein
LLIYYLIENLLIFEDKGKAMSIEINNTVDDYTSFRSTAIQWKPLANELRLVDRNNFSFFMNLVYQQNKLILMNDNDYQWEYLSNILKNIIKFHRWHMNKEGEHATAAEYFMATLFHISGDGLLQGDRPVTAVDYFKKMHNTFSRNWKGVTNIDRIINMCQYMYLPYPLPKDLPTYVRIFGLSASMALRKNKRGTM